MTDTPEQSRSGGELLLGIVLGAVIGAAVSLLYAPKPGKETREDLLRRLDELKETVDETTRQLTEAAQAKLNEARADLTKVVEAGREAAKEQVADLRRQAGLE